MGPKTSKKEGAGTAPDDSRVNGSGADTRARILLVDDEPRNLEVLEAILASPDYELIRARTADEALLALVQGDFAAIVLDIQMPGMNGLELANLIKQRRRTQHIPIIFLTAYFSDDKDVLQGYSAGAVDYLTKPINPQIIRSKISVMVDLFRTTRALAESNAALESQIAQRQKAEEDLRNVNAQLEERVKERTADLSRVNRDLRRSEERYRLILENALEYAIFTIDKEGRVTTWNAGAQRTLGFEEQEIVGQRLDKIFTQSDAEHGQLDLEMGRALTNGRAQDERWHLRKDGSPFYANGVMMPLRDEDGQHLGFLKILRDGTSRRRAEETLRESEERFRGLIFALPAAVYTTDREGRINLYNDAAVELWGRKPEINVDKWCGSSRILRPDGTVLPHDECPMAVALREGRSLRDQEIIVERADGHSAFVLSNPEPLRDASGQIIGGVNMLVDITERKRAESARTRLAAIVESSADAIISKDLHGVIQNWNGGAERLFGYSAQEMFGQPITIIIPTDHHREELALLDRLRAGERLDHFETVRKTKEGRVLAVSLTASPLRDATGHIVGVSTIARDISERKRSDERFIQLNETLISVMESIPDALYVTSLEGGIKFKNPVGSRFMNEVGLENRLPAPIEAELQQVIQTGEHHLPTSFKTLHRFQLAGEERYFLSRILRMSTAHERPFGAVVMLQDVTELRLLDEVKTNLISTVSHELKTPITSLRTAVLLLLEQNLGSLTERQREMLDIARDEAERLLRTLNALLDLTRFEDNAVGMKLELVRPENLVHPAIEETRQLAAAAKVTVRAEIQEELPALQMDRERMLHVLTNLLINAIKYAPESTEVVIRARQDNNAVSFAVSDRGPGIPPQYQSRIFERFFRVPGTPKKGAGLGLAIARECVRAHRGQIGVRSLTGHGSEFYFTLPAPS